MIRSLLDATTFLSLLNLLPTHFWLFEINQNFGVYYLAVHFLGVVFFLLQMRKTPRKVKFFRFSLHAALALFYVVPLIPYYSSAEFTSGPDAMRGTNVLNRSLQEITVGYANVYHPAGGCAALGPLFSSSEPTLLAVVEFSRACAERFDLHTRYPYRIEVRRSDDFGIALYSKFPLESQGQESLGEGLVPVIRAQVKLAERSLALYVIHFHPPTSAQSAHQNRLLYRRLATEIRNRAENRVLVIGDFNATPHSQLFQRFMTWTGLESAGWGEGLKRTWNAQHPLLRFTIDHALLGGATKKTAFQIHEAIETDHYPISIRLQVW